MSDTRIIRCKHCDQPIAWDEVFHWIHGVMGGGWNTSCEDDEHRAVPNDDWIDTTLISIKDFLEAEKEQAEAEERRAAYFEDLLKTDEVHDDKA